VTAETRRKIRAWREKELSAGEIAQLLSEDGADISVRTVERVLAEEGFPKLPRRTRMKIGLTVKGAEILQRSEGVSIAQLEGQHFTCESAGAFLFAPFLEKFQMSELIRSAGLPGTKVIPAVSYFLSFLALKLIGTERYGHMGDHAFDPGLGLFAGLNILPKCTAMSTYSYSLDEVHILKLQQAFVKKAVRLGLYGWPRSSGASSSVTPRRSFEILYGERPTWQSHPVRYRSPIPAGRITQSSERFPGRECRRPSPGSMAPN
jgi:hypothetical protein